MIRALLPPRALGTAGVIAVLVTLGCSRPAETNQAPEQDSIWAGQLVGTWVAEESEPVWYYSEKTCRADGTADGYILTKSPSGMVVRANFRSTWRVENGHVIGRVMECDDPEGYLKAGDKFSDQIVSVSESEFVFVAEDGSRCVRKRKH